MGEDDLVGNRLGTEAQLQTSRNVGLRAGSGSGLDHRLIEQVLELRAPGFEANSVRVREVIGDVVHIHLLGSHAAGGAEQGSDHCADSLSKQ